MAIQSNMNLMGVNYSDANALWKQAVDQLANAGEKTRKQVNINQEKFDSNVLGYVNQLANKHGVDTPEFEQGMQQILAQNPNNNLDMGTILANAMKSRGDNLGLQKAGLENQITQGGIDDAQIINSVAHLIAKRNRTPEEEAQVQQAYNSVNVTNLLEPTLKAKQLDDTYKLQGLTAAFGGYAAGAQGPGVFFGQPESQLTGGTANIDLLAGLTGSGYGGGGAGGTGGGTGGLFPSAPTAQTQTSGNAGGARVPDAYAQYVNQASKKHGVHSTLIAAVMRAESEFEPNASSSKGAQGLMQLMPGTAKDMGVTNPWDPGQNIEGGTKYLSNMLKKYNGNVGHALMAYNWGPGNTDKYLAGKARPPKETLDYVRKVTANLREDTAATRAARASNTSAGTSTGGGSQAVNTPFKVSQWDANVSGKALQSRLKIKQNESVANGSVARPTAQFAEIVQGHLGNNLKYFSAFNDTYHAGSNSKHAKGTAFDVVLKDGVSKQEAAAVTRNLQQVAAASGFRVKILDEYNNPSKNSTGGHIHVTVEGQAQPGDPLSAEGYMGGLSLQDALGMLGPAPERPANIAPDPAAFNLIMDQLGLDKDDPIVGMYKQFVDLGAKRGKQVVDYQQAYRDYEQYNQDRVNLQDHYLKSLVNNKIKIDSSMAAIASNQQEMQQLQQMTGGSLTGLFAGSQEMAKDFVEYITGIRGYDKDTFYNATPEEQLTLVGDFLTSENTKAGLTVTNEVGRKIDGVVNTVKGVQQMAVDTAKALAYEDSKDAKKDTDVKKSERRYANIATYINRVIGGAVTLENDAWIETLPNNMPPSVMEETMKEIDKQYTIFLRSDDAKKYLKSKDVGKIDQWWYDDTYHSDYWTKEGIVNKHLEEKFTEIAADVLQKKAKNYYDTTEQNVTTHQAKTVAQGNYKNLQEVQQAIKSLAKKHYNN